MLNDKYFPKDGGLLGPVVEVEGYKYPHLQLRNISYSRGSRRVLDSISLEARGGELVAILATNSK
jgi:ABC-type molybdenum transport system ATPase subunit/photorepair protein PhrA